MVMGLGLSFCGPPILSFLHGGAFGSGACPLDCDLSLLLPDDDSCLVVIWGRESRCPRTKIIVRARGASSAFISSSNSRSKSKSKKSKKSAMWQLCAQDPRVVCARLLQ